VNWELLIAGAGLALGAVNVIAWWIERRDRKAEVAEERRVRSEQLEMERERFRVEQEDRERSQRAEITAEQAGYERSSGEGTYHFRIKNLGPSWAKHIAVDLRDDDGNPVTPGVTVGYLERGEETRATILVPQHLWEKQQPVSLWVAWRDDSGGPYEERSNAAVRL
jgi:hypothetical protein